jgi:hypothetical protein
VKRAFAGKEENLMQAKPDFIALPDPPLEWSSRYPEPLLARGSSLDLLPDAGSPLFITLGMPILTKVYLKTQYRKSCFLRLDKTGSHGKLASLCTREPANENPTGIVLGKANCVHV